MDEAEVEHLVGLVENEDLDIAQAQRPAIDEIEQTAGRGDENVDAEREIALLLADGDAAEHHRGGELQVAAIGAEAVGDLAGQFAGRAQHENAAALADGSAGIFRQAMEDRQRERRRLAGAGLGDAADVAAGHHIGDGLRLDRGGLLVAFGRKRLQDRLGQSEIGEKSQSGYLSSRKNEPKRPSSSCQFSWKTGAAGLLATTRVWGSRAVKRLKKGAGLSTIGRISVTQPRSSGSRSER